MKSLKELCNITESKAVINVYIQMSGSMYHSDTLEIAEKFLKSHKSANIFLFNIEQVIKVNSIKDIIIHFKDFAGPHPGSLDHVLKHMEKHIGETCILFAN